MSDLCAVCQKNYISLHKLNMMNDEEKRMTIDDMRIHLDKVTVEREFYNRSIRESKESSTTIHFTFDMAQQVCFRLTESFVLCDENKMQ